MSDLHLEFQENSRYLRYNELPVTGDVLVLAGDIFYLKDKTAPVMNFWKWASKNYRQVLIVPGNHEYISGIKSCRDYIRENTSITWLQDSIVVLPNGIQIVGRDDRSNRNRRLLSQLVEPLDSQLPILLLDHQPYHLEETKNAGVDLQFSGHTHHGQVWPLNLLTDYLFEVSYGYRQFGSTHVYVSSGLSLWGPPFRIGTRSEMVIFNLNFK